MATECERLTDRFNAMRNNGLVDVKFFLRNTDDATKDAVCAEVNAMLDAVDAGECVKLEFNDSYHS
jgi:hypothetical protein